MAAWGAALSAGGFSATTMLFSLGASMILGGVYRCWPRRQKHRITAQRITADRTRIFLTGQHDCSGEPDAGALR